jgi:hypothetical protein
MNPAVLLEIISKWEHQAIMPDCVDGHPDAIIGNAREAGERDGRRACAEELNLLVKLLAK